MWLFIVLGLVILILMYQAIAAEKMNLKKEDIAKAFISFELALKDKEFYISKCMKYNAIGLYVDDINKQWSVPIKGFQNPKIYDYKDLIEVEIYENGNTIVSGKIGSTLMGGILFGGAGAIAASSAKREINSICNSLQIRLRVNDLQNPEIIIRFYDGKLSKNQKVYENVFENLKQFAATFSYIQNNYN